MSAMTATDERLKQIDFSNKLYASPGALVAPVGSTLLPTAASLAGKRVGIDQGTTQEAYAKAEWATKGVTIVSYQNQDRCIRISSTAASTRPSRTRRRPATRS